MATYLKSSGKNAVYVLVKNYEFEQFKAISSKYSRSGESIFYGEGLDRDFSFVPDKMYIPKGKNISVFEFDGKHTLERSGATCYFVGRAQYEQGKDGGNGDMIIHFW